MKNSDTEVKASTNNKDIKISDMATSMNTKPPIINKRSMNAAMKKMILILAGLVLVLGATTFYFYKNSKLAKDSMAAEQREAKILAERVGELVVLPTDELPTIATVSDPEALRDQSFFVDAKRGDKVLIYSNAKKAILYDPVANKIINIAPLNNTEQKTTTPVSTPITTPNPDSKKETQF